MTRSRRFVVTDEPTRLDHMPGFGRGARSVIFFNAGQCVVGIGGADVTTENCFRGLAPKATISMDLASGEPVFGIVAPGFVGEVDVFGTAR